MRAEWAELMAMRAEWAGLTAMRAEWAELKPPLRPGKEAGTEAEVLGPAPRPSSGTKIKAWPQPRAS